MPFFKAKGLDLSNYYKGTINIDIAPYHYAIKTPTHYIEGVDWSPHIPPENFYFFQLQLEFKGQLYDGIIYMPDPKTKVDHHQLATMLEVMMPPISGIQGGEKVRLFIPEGSLPPCPDVSIDSPSTSVASDDRNLIFNKFPFCP